MSQVLKFHPVLRHCFANAYLPKRRECGLDLSTSRDGKSPTSLGALLHVLIILPLEQFFCLSSFTLNF